MLANDISAALRGTATPDHADGDDRRQRHLPLYVKSNSVDTFALSYSGTDFNAGIVPAGWRVEFRSPTAGTCDAPGAQIMNARVTETADPSDTTTPDATLIACAVVSTPEDAAQSTQKVYFKATGTSGVSSAKLDAVTISANRQISPGANQTQQVAPGGSVTYSHVLTNQGNQAEGGTCSAMSFSGDNSLAGDGWTSVVYYDANNNGELDPSDPVVESLAQITASGSTPTAPPPWRARCLRARVCACSSRSSLRRARPPAKPTTARCRPSSRTAPAPAPAPAPNRPRKAWWTPAT